MCKHLGRSGAQHNTCLFPARSVVGSFPSQIDLSFPDSLAHLPITDFQNLYLEEHSCTTLMNGVTVEEPGSLIG